MPLPALPAVPAITTPEHSLKRGRVLLRQLAGSRHDYLLYLPPGAGPGAQVLVTVHGISRNAREHVRLFRPWADAYGVILVAPIFDRQHFPSYQRLDGMAPDRADLVLQRILNEASQATGIAMERPCLFGFSGGGQFVHRYLMAYPDRVAAAALGAPGWYTFPSLERRYPYGLREAEARVGGRFEPEDFLNVPIALFVGDRDVARGSSLKSRTKLDARQGRNRLERAERWIAAMRHEAERRGMPARLEFGILPDSGHSFRRCVASGQLAQKVFEFLFGHRQ